MRISNFTRDTLLARDARLADDFFSRLIGLLNKSTLEPGQGLIITRSNAIHSFFMRFTFDAVFVDKNSRVVAVCPDFKPFRISRVFLRATTTIELPAGTIATSGTRPGDEIKILPQ